MISTLNVSRKIERDTERVCEEKKEKKKEKKKKSNSWETIVGKTLFTPVLPSKLVVCTVKQLRVPTPVRGYGVYLGPGSFSSRLDFRRLGWISLEPTVDGPPNSILARSASHPSLVDVSPGLLTLVH